MLDTDAGHGRRSVAAGVLLCLALGALGAAAGFWWGTERGGEVRTAEAVVLLRPLEGNPFNPSTTGADLVNLETEAQMVGSGLVTGLAADRLGAAEEAGELRAGLDVTVPPNTQLVEITAEGSDGQEAADRAQVLAETFLAFRADRSESDTFDRGARLREEISTREARRRQLVSSADQVKPQSAKAVIREQRIDELTTQLGELRVRLAELEAASTDPGQVVTAASAAPPGVLSRPWVLALLGAGLGLVVALLVLAGRRRLDERVHGPEDLSDAGVPVLGRLPREAGQRPRAVGGVRAAILAAETRRPLVVGVAAGAASDPDDALATTADLTGELALSLRRSGLVVAVLDLATRRGDPADGVDVTPGHDGLLLALSTLLDAQQDVPDVLARRRASGLPLAVVNDLGNDGLADRASSPEMASLLDAARHVADAVVVDIGSLEETSAQSLVGAVDAVVLTLTQGTSTFPELETSMERLPRWGGRLAGVVLVGAGRSRRGRPSRSAHQGRADDETRTSAAEALLSGPTGGDAPTLSSFVSEEPR